MECIAQDIADLLAEEASNIKNEKAKKQMEEFASNLKAVADKNKDLKKSLIQVIPSTGKPTKNIPNKIKQTASTSEVNTTTDPLMEFEQLELTKVFIDAEDPSKLLEVYDKYKEKGYSDNDIFEPVKDYADTYYNTYYTDKDLLAIVKEAKKTLEEGYIESKKGFQGYVGGFDEKGKGSLQGDGKDKAMRKVANGFIGEAYKKTRSSTHTSWNHFNWDMDRFEGSQTLVGKQTLISGDETGVIMLARNSSLKGDAISFATKQMIDNAFEQQATFVVGDMKGVDTQFIDYLDKIGASYKIYHTGDKSRIEKEPAKQEDDTIDPIIPDIC